MEKVLVIEDEHKLRHLIATYLEKWNFSVLAIESFEEIDQVAADWKPDIILLDINLPSFDGFYWCQKIREVTAAPIVFISSRTENMDIVMAMNVGGDDYIQKPFSLEVLTAKLKAILRRSKTSLSPETAFPHYNGLKLNVDKATISFGEKEAILTKNEFLILSILMKKPGQIATRDAIMRVLWEDENFIDDNTLTVNMNRLRKKLESIGRKEVIHTRKGQGYILQ
ncbi:DNA-binding response regulator [Neobacillus notoginsengisoli]|uniref:DNA-binding response regulator n=1 Tax=Neobacillus notoginsengisoli TaxID=1578198 RepID=A0A417YPH3_9BACI|nr:response regulator transcription factor [Neobacillus notoginsengisoli]RHW35695.1 DNA-binding response regulator [Neobacillus notoginsengisoli]